MAWADSSHASEEQPAFLSATAAMADVPAIGTLEMASDQSISGRDPVGSSHPGASRLAARIFALSIVQVVALVLDLVGVH
jgi:hypothetical protein